ncbi:MAG: histidine kinase [Bacteroidota bacterium]
MSFTQLGRLEPNLIPRMVVNPILLYVNYLVLVPRLLLRKKLLAYIVISFVLVNGFSFILSRTLFPVPIQRIIDLAENESLGPVKQLPFALTLIFSLAFFLLGGVLGLIKDFYRRDKINQEIAVSRKETELQFLRAQLNPHFLFNSLNSIYSLVRNKSHEAPEAVITLSELMRYMLYEAKEAMVPLSKEINYIQNFMALQRFRLKDSSGLKMQVVGDYKDKKIPPLLLIPFVENAFKYGTDFHGNTTIDIKMEIIGADFFFSIENKVGHYRKDKINSGIGLKNIEDRLRLIYPDNHVLRIHKNEDRYQVALELNLAS